jgi:type IV pilus assembly protein PilN
MRVSVNLATRPFVELRPFFLRLRVLMGALAVVGIAAIIAAHILQVKLDVAQAQIDRLHAKTVAAQQEKQGNERRMRQPANAAVLERAHFLNALFLRKSFSWTAVMMDLETVLPSGVQVTSIEPSPSAEGDLIIRLRVSGDRDRAVQLVRNLERSKRFLAPKLTGEALQAKPGSAQANTFAANNGAPAGVEFEILANYNPLPEGESYAAIKAPKGASGKASSRDNTMPPAAKGYGVVLKPYSATHPHAAPGSRPAASNPRVPNGGPR